MTTFIACGHITISHFMMTIIFLVMYRQWTLSTFGIWDRELDFIDSLLEVYL